MTKIGLIQVSDRDCYNALTTAQRQDKLYHYAECCLKEGADVVLFPEAYQHAGNPEVKSNLTYLEENGAAWRARLSALSKQYGGYIIAWDYLVEDGKVYNGSYILDRSGNEVGRYRKVNLTHPELAQGITRGSSYPVFDLDFGKVGIMICYDNYFPESASILASKGAEVIFYPLYGDTRKPQWERRNQTRAADHGVYIVASQIGSAYDVAYSGVYAQDGEILAKLEGESWQIVEIDVKKKPVTFMGGDPNRREYFRDIIHKTRNYKAFAEAAQEGETPKEWEEIYLDGIPN